MMPSTCNEQAPVPPPSYHRREVQAQAQRARALHINALTLIQTLYQLAVCGRILKRGNQDRKERAMARITRAAPHLSVEEVKERMNNDPNPLYRKRWLIIYNVLIDPREAKVIAKHTGVSVKTVHKLISTYNRLGIAAVETPGKGGRRNEYLTLE